MTALSSVSNIHSRGYMSRWLRVVAGLSAAAGFLLQPPATAEDLDGRAIMDEVARRHEQPVEVSTERMILVDGQEVEADRLMTRLVRRKDTGAYRYLIFFDSPSGIAGSASLTWEVKGAQDDQWLYLPAFGRLRRVVGGAKRRSFMGTDFSFEDLTVEDEDAYFYTREPDRDIGSRSHFVVLAEPAAPDIIESSGYSMRRIFVRADNFFITRVDYFDRNSGDLIKTLAVESAVPVVGETWRATRYSMRNHREDHETRVELLDVSFAPDDVPSIAFEHRYLTSRAHMR